MERLNYFIDDKLIRPFFKFFASEYPGEVIDHIVNEELQGRGLNAKSAERAQEWLQEEKARGDNPDE